MTPILIYVILSLMISRWVTINEVQQITGWSRSTVLRYINLGILEKKQVTKVSKIYIDYYSIPSFIRERNENAK